MIEKDNSLAFRNPELAKEWHLSKNGDLTPNDVTIGSGKTVWWLGKCGHEWEATINERHRGYGCPICAGKRIVPGINDLASQQPLIAQEWLYEENGDLSPTMVAATSHKVVRWKCKKGHTYNAPIDARVRGRGCPYCAHKLVLKGENDLATVNPFLASEWSKKNYPLMPDAVFANSHRVVSWVCSLCREEWTASIYSRQVGNGCPKCAKQMHSSFPEQAVYYYVKKAYPDAISGYRDIFDSVMELDVYIPSISIGIEYDGHHWHSEGRSKQREREKYSICKSHKITLIRIREKSKQDVLSESDDCDILIHAEKELKRTIIMLTEYLPKIDDIDISRDRSIIWSQYISGLKENSLASLYPDLAKEWHPIKNGDLTPGMVAAKSDKMIWWLCPNGHSYESTVSHRTHMGSNCPYCSNRKLLKGYNDFLTTNKDNKLFEEWDTEKNLEIGITMDSLMEGSNIKVFWQCPRGHSYQTTINERKRGSCCSICAGKLVVPGINDLKALNPDLATEWHPTRNGDLLPSQVTAKSNKNVWWLCSVCGESWKSIINTRAKGAGCPYCSGKYVVSGKTDLEALNPTLAKEWHPTKNGDLLPSHVRPGSGKKVWWTCKICGNEWTAAIKDRNRGSGCPSCARKRRSKKQG